MEEIAFDYEAANCTLVLNVIKYYFACNFSYEQLIVPITIKTRTFLKEFSIPSVYK